MKEKCLISVMEEWKLKDYFDSVLLVLDDEKTHSNEKLVKFVNGHADHLPDWIERTSYDVAILKESTFKKLRDSFLDISDFDKNTTYKYKFSYFEKWCKENFPNEWEEFYHFISNRNWSPQYEVGVVFNEIEKEFKKNSKEWEYEEETEAASN